jgi:hypothetical protein
VPLARGGCDVEKLAEMVMLCAKCHKNVATIHITNIVGGTEQETLHVCKDCVPPAGFAIGKKCEFCGRDAISGEMRPGGVMVYWCYDCELERVAILKQLLRDTGLQAWSASASASAREQVTQTLKERRQQHGRDKGS